MLKIYSSCDAKARSITSAISADSSAKGISQAQRTVSVWGDAARPSAETFCRGMISLYHPRSIKVLPAFLRMKSRSTKPSSLPSRSIAT